MLEIDIIKSKIPFNDLLPDKVSFFLKQLQNADINDEYSREVLINTFVNKIYLYDDRFVIFFQTQRKEVKIEKELLEKAESLFLASSAPPNER